MDDLFVIVRACGKWSTPLGFNHSSSNTIDWQFSCLSRFLTNGISFRSDEAEMTKLKRSGQAHFRSASWPDSFPPNRFALCCSRVWLKGEPTCRLLLIGIHEEFAQGVEEMSIYIIIKVLLEGNMESCEDNDKHVCEWFYQWWLSISDSYLSSLSKKESQSFGVVVHWWLIFHAFDWNTEILLPMTKSENLVEVISWKLIPVAVESPLFDN